MWQYAADADLEELLADTDAVKVFAESTGRLNLYPYLRATVSRLCSDAGLDVPPLPPMMFPLPGD